MTIQSVGDSPEPIQGPKHETNLQNNNNEKECSIFNTDDNKNDVTTAEQKFAAKIMTTKSDTIKEAIAKGFNLDKYLNMFDDIFKTVQIQTKEQIETVDLIIMDKISKAIMLLEEFATDFIKTIDNPPQKYDSTDLMGFGEEHRKYMRAKLESNGIIDINYELLAKCMFNAVYDFDENHDLIYSKEEANKFGSYVRECMNKNEKGEVIDTHVLDWVVNQYIKEVKTNIE